MCTNSNTHFHVWNIVRNVHTQRIGMVVGVSEGYGYAVPIYDVEYDNGSVFAGTARTYEKLAETPQEYEAMQQAHEEALKEGQHRANDDAERRTCNGDDSAATTPEFKDGEYVAITRNGFRHFGEIIGQFDLIHYGVAIRTYKIKVGDIVHYATASELMHARRGNR